MADILLLDDDEGVREAVGMMLESAGHTVRSAPDGRIGLQYFKESRPALVVTDIIMPHREGIETIRAIRALDATVPIIAMSGGDRFRSVDFLTLSLQLGATVTLAKPFHVAEFLDLVTRLLEAASGAG